MAMKNILTTAMKAATDVANKHKGEIMGDLKNIATNAMKDANIRPDMINSITNGKIPANMVQNGLAQFSNYMATTAPAAPPMQYYQPPVPISQPINNPIYQYPVGQYPQPIMQPQYVAPSAPTAPMVSQSSQNSLENTTPTTSGSTSEELINRMKHSVYSDEEINILKLMHMNHLKNNVGEDVVNERILNVMQTALNNQLSTETTKTVMERILLQQLPKIAEKIGELDNNTLSEIIFRKTMNSINIRKLLEETLREVVAKNTVVKAEDATQILIDKINAAELPTQTSQQIGQGLGNIYPFKSVKNNRTKVRPRRTVSIL